jgi:hypothetical protein
VGTRIIEGIEVAIRVGHVHFDSFDIEHAHLSHGDVFGAADLYEHSLHL